MKRTILFSTIVTTSCSALLADETGEAQVSGPETPLYVLAEYVIKDQQTANIMPVTTYDTPVSNLEFNPRVDFQSRNMAEAQGDVTIRGGIFENTGFRVGSVTLMDPQTGHYFAEIPIAPEMLTIPEVLVAGDNALYGFNSTVGTISYDWIEIGNGGSLTLGGGDNDLNFQRLHHATTGELFDSGKWTWGAEIEYSRSESDGTIQNGEHDFDRFSGRVQLLGPNSQTDLFAGYQSKFFGWPGMYTADRFDLSPEFENLKTRLYVLNHRQNYGEDNFIELTAMHRRHTDNYILDATNYIPFPFVFVADHETTVTALGFSGFHRLSPKFGLNYAGQIAGDEIESTSLENTFTSRSYGKFTLLPEYALQLNQSDSLTFRAGASYDDTNRGNSEVSLIGDVTWERSHGNGNSESIYLSYAETSQVAGYTAIGGGTTSGIFRSNPFLERETSQNLELGGKIKQASWSLEAAVFYRWDDDLVDWTFSNADLFARSANGVDIETYGVEMIATKSWNKVQAIASYAFLDKDEDYGDVTIDGSFYALNYANHRVTLGLIWTPTELFKVSIDNEWRSQEENALRNSDDEAIFTHASVTFYPPNIENLELFVAVDNAWDDDFEEVPGTPGRGVQTAVGGTFRW
ncbi:MAG: TonB-dependent receptor [Verrucomicrobiota bacterium]